MNARQRYLESLLFGAPDRIPLHPGWGRKSTREVWRTQGLPAEIPDAEILEYAYRQAGGKLPWPADGSGFAVDQRMIPQFEEKILERRKDSQIVQDWKGNICEIGNEFSVEYLRTAIDFVTRRWIKCPVETRADWQQMKQRYNPADPQRYPQTPQALGKELANRQHYLGLSFSGPFWQLREWVGFENLCMLFYDDPDFIREMIFFWQEFVSQLLKNTFQYVIPDEVHLSEDMAYKSFSMISPKMVREYLLPVWIHWGEIIRAAGVPVYAMDSDGFTGELIPLWIEAGINVCDPVEVAAGNDIVEFRKRFGKKMAYRGGVDKRAIAKGGACIATEMQRLGPVIGGGGFIPGCDHAVPPDVSWDHFIDYLKLLSRATGWL